MENYNKEYRIDFTPEQEKEFRAQLDRWCKAEEGYDGPLFGQQVKILEVWQSIIYKAAHHKQFDQRILQRDTAPTNQQFSPSITEYHQVDVWARAALPTTFVQKPERIIVNESRETHTCKTCGGAGKITCSECNGVGTVIEKYTVETPCSHCHDGFISIPKTEYLWITNSEGKSVRVCKTGEEKKPCSYCKGYGTITEKKKHRVTCRHCNGNGEIICSVCKGTGKLVHFIYIDRTLYQETDTQYIVPSILNANETNEISSFIEQQDWQQLEQFRIERTAFDDCQASSRPLVGDMIKRLFQAAGDSKNSLLCFSTLTTSKCDVIALRYEYNGREYNCVLIGKEKKLFAVTSPISEYADKLRAKAIESVKKKDIASSWKTLRRIVRFSQTSESDRIALAAVEKRMALTSHYGKLGGALLASFLLFPILTDIFAYYNVVAPWTQLIYYTYSPILDAPIRAVVGLGLAYWLIKKTKYFRTPHWVYLHKSGFLRVLFGMMWGLISMIAASIITLVLNYLGILHIFMILLLLLVGIIGSVISLIVMIIFLIAH